MKYMDMLKKVENAHPEELQKVQKDHFTVFAVPEGACIQKNRPLYLRPRNRSPRPLM
jgi:hypothetical protein